jgi:hypothetical protein
MVVRRQALSAQPSASQPDILLPQDNTPAERDNSTNNFFQVVDSAPAECKYPVVSR